MINCLTDTNIVLRWSLPADPQYRVCRRAVRRLRAQDIRPCVTPQVLLELWAVVTRPQAVNGMGRTPDEAARLLQRVRRVFPMLEETPSVYLRWQRLALRHSIIGKQTYDTRLVAVMQVHGVDRLLTFNGDHFRRFADITVIDPQTVP